MITNNQKAIILTSIIATILTEYKDDEKSKAISDLIFVCNRFMKAQSGTVRLPFGGVKVIDRKKHTNYIETVLIGDKIWKKRLTNMQKMGLPLRRYH